MSILKASGITKIYSDKTVIKDVSLELNKGEIISLLGVSGSGKTTLFNCLSGILMPEEGSVTFHDEDITGKPGKISYMLQKDLLFPHKKIIDNVSLPLVIKGINKKEAREKAAEYFNEFGLAGTENKYPAMLSGGMRQRAALLRTYLASDGVALLDEPFSALDTITKSSIHNWFIDIMQHIDLSIVFITHDIDEAILLSDKILILGGTPAHIVKEIELKEKKPRGEHFNLTEEFLNYKKQVIEALDVKNKD